MHDPGRDARCFFDKRASSPAGSSRLLGTRSERAWSGARDARCGRAEGVLEGSRRAVVTLASGQKRSRPQGIARAAAALRPLSSCGLDRAGVRRWRIHRRAAGVAGGDDRGRGRRTSVSPNSELSGSIGFDALDAIRRVRSGLALSRFLVGELGRAEPNKVTAAAPSGARRASIWTPSSGTPTELA
jgi:hypothetical protein